MEETDRQLLSRYRGGQIDALEMLVNRYKRPLFGYIMGMTRNKVEADDVFQEVWFRAIRKIGGYRHGNMLGWLTRIAHNLVIDRARRKKPDASLDAESEEGASIMNIIPEKGPDPAETVGSGEIGRRISEAVRQLPAEQREVFLLRSNYDMPFKEIAKIQKVSINTALARMQYALAGLRPLLSEVYNEL